MSAIDEPTERDLQLGIAAVHFGRELASLRVSAIPRTVRGFNRPRLVRLLVAFANQQYLTLQAKVRKELKAQKGGRLFDMERAQQLVVEGAGGQEMPPDDLVTYLVDSLPHWLFHAWQVADDAPSNEPEPVIDFAAAAFRIFSIEHSLRHLWLEALWLGTRLRKDGETLVDEPWDRDLTARWLVWAQRDLQNITAEFNIDAGAHIVAGGRRPPVVPAIERTVIRISRPPSGRRVFVTGRATGAKPEQRNHVSERDALDRLYTGLFMDETLPKSPGGDLTCRELSRAWWILKDMARLAADDLGPAWWETDGDVERFSLKVGREDLIRIIAECLHVTAERAGSMIDWFTCNPADTSRIFAKSVWAEPLIPEPGTGNLQIVLAPLLSASPVKRIEAWMERGGISDSRGLKGRGKPFERHVRRVLSDVLAANELLTDVSAAEHGLKRKGESEEIDLLVRVGEVLLVGEVKCFVAPSEPTDKRNHLANLDKATAQAEAKRAWADANRGAVAEALAVDASLAAKLRVMPVVVLNHGFGMGLERYGVPVVDLHYLRILLGWGCYHGGARFERHVGVSYETITLYRSQAEFEAKVDVLLRDPPPLERFNERVTWRRIPFQTSNDKPFVIELPAISENAPTSALRDLRSVQLMKKRT
ncbi:hypothetical protein [Sphingomonas arenae]|uniref:hypothetical protein n=1 Tax=Sphingomonas arenae TaxID=2812555 RepID=UPI00196755B1|nr:hypothetical protein [Sphingomonas arenae]